MRLLDNVVKAKQNVFTCICANFNVKFEKSI